MTTDSLCMSDAKSLASHFPFPFLFGDPVAAASPPSVTSESDYSALRSGPLNQDDDIDLAGMEIKDIQELFTSRDTLDSRS